MCWRSHVPFLAWLESFVIYQRLAFHHFFLPGNNVIKSRVDIPFFYWHYLAARSLVLISLPLPPLRPSPSHTLVISPTFPMPSMASSFPMKQPPRDRQTKDEKPNISQGDQSSSSNPTDTHAELHSEHYPSIAKLMFICLGLFLAVLCVGLDRLILATVIPKITSDFASLPDIGWYGSAYMLTSCCFQLMFGKLYAGYSVKWLFVITLSIFELGSIICASAPNSPTLIVGRAVAGLGSAGVLTGAMVILTHSVPLHNRPKVTGGIGGAVGIAQIISPTLGGAFTDYATWRWCFWINLPLGGLALAAVILFVHLPPQVQSTKSTKGMRQVAEKFDLLGTLFLLPALVSLLLSLQWGGSEYAWSSWRMVLTLAIFGVFIVIWGFIQFRAGDNATVPVRIISMRSMLAAVWFMLSATAVAFTIIQFVPVWFQATRGSSAFQSGINFLATTVSMSIMAVLSGFMTSKIGYYVPQMIASTVLTSVAAGLITRFDLDTSTSYWIGSLILAGLGLGIGGQQPLMVPQTILSGGDIAIGTSVMMFAQTLSGTICISVANSVFQQGLVDELSVRAPGVDPRVVANAGAQSVAESMRKVYPDSVEQILVSYSKALQRVWVIPVVLACLSIFGSAFQEWRSVRKGKDAEHPKP
ncbi:major facilitator superfamily domain-containing protein [Podospora appendiculata]|uniref:Major facilitator superfamily domain-containing protein n=1 Tax=Podospora appendiculata TaxID=314037 RepID=A0AAE0X937_9PEZI|nr:major facilitator superfamily domain-containing protein [Podospora appendiculata]